MAGSIVFCRACLSRKGIGSNVIKLIEAEYPSIRIWDLETSSRQINNHHFIKDGLPNNFESEDEYCYVKRIGTSSNKESVFKMKT